MKNEISVGDCVILTGMPDWLIHDLPEDEQIEMLSFVGKQAVVQEIDAYGYYWLGFGNMVEDEDGALYSGHSFGIPKEHLKLQE